MAKKNDKINGFTAEEWEEIRKADVELEEKELTAEDYWYCDLVEQLLFPKKTAAAKKRSEQYKKRKEKKIADGTWEKERLADKEKREKQKEYNRERRAKYYAKNREAIIAKQKAYRARKAAERKKEKEGA